MPDIDEIIGKCPLLVAYIDRVLTVPEIKTWVEKRPDSEIWDRNRYDACSTCKLIMIITNDTNKVSLYNVRIAVIEGNMGRFPFSPKFRKFRLEIKWKEPFQFCLTGIFGITFVPLHWTKLLSPVPLFCILLTRTIIRRAVAWVGSVQPECTVPLSTWNFRNETTCENIVSRYQTLVFSLPREAVFLHRRPKTEFMTWVCRAAQ